LCSKHGYWFSEAQTPTAIGLIPNSYSWFWVSWTGAIIKGGVGNQTDNWQATSFYLQDANFQAITHLSLNAPEYTATQGANAQWIVPCQYRPPGNR